MNKKFKNDFQVFDPEANGLVPFVDEVETFNKTFNNVTSHPNENCTGQKCKDCMVCYTTNNINTIIEKVK